MDKCFWKLLLDIGFDFVLAHWCNSLNRQKTCHLIYYLACHRWKLNTLPRSSRLQTFFKIDILKNVAIFAGKHLCWSLFILKFFNKKRLQSRCFLVNIAKFLRTAFFRAPPVAASNCLTTRRQTFRPCFCRYLTLSPFSMSLSSCSG